MFFILVSSTVSAAQPAIAITRLTTSGSALNPAIYDDKIVWSDVRNGKVDVNGRIENSDIYLYDLSTNEETRISYGGSGFFPAIYGDRVVWTDIRNGNDTDIYMYNLSTHNETQVSHSGSALYSAIYGNRIVWEDMRNGKPDIYMYDLSTGKETRISYSRSVINPLGIYGNITVWNEFYYENMSYNTTIQGIVNYDIYIYNLSTNKETQIPNTKAASLPKIYDDRVVWMDSRNGNSDIYIYDLSNKTESQITSGSKTASDPAIYGSRVIWRECRNSNGSSKDIYMYDLSSKKETRITTSGSTCSAAIYGDKIVWIVSPTERGIGDIYIGNLKSLIANFSAFPNTENAPLSVKFTDKSLGSPSMWTWDFGDGNNSTERNPDHTYSSEGNYTVTLIVDDANQTDTKKNKINVQSAPYKIPDGFNFMIFLMIALYLFKRST